MKAFAALAERVLLALARAGDEAVQRDRDMAPKLAHVLGDLQVVSICSAMSIVIAATLCRREVIDPRLRA
jgi:hypothetical protein